VLGAAGYLGACGAHLLKTSAAGTENARSTGTWASSQQGTLLLIDHSGDRVRASRTGEQIVDIHQTSAFVLVRNIDKIHVLDVTGNSIAFRDLAESWDVHAGGGTVVLAHPERGVHVAHHRDLEGLDLDGPPTYVSSGIRRFRVSVGVHGTTAILDESTLHLYPAPAPGEHARLFRSVGLGSVPRADDTAAMDLTMVGEEPVVLDPVNLEISFPLHRHWSQPLPVSGSAATLQVPGPRARSTAIATSTALMRIPCPPGATRTLVDRTGGSGTPSRPMVLGTGAVTLWSDIGLLQIAVGEGARVLQAPRGQQVGALRLRTDGEQVLLNDHITGQAWRAAQDLTETGAQTLTTFDGDTTRQATRIARPA
jgi:hypothetical protein